MKVIAKLEIGMAGTFDHDDLIMTFERWLPNKYLSEITKMKTLDKFVIDKFGFTGDNDPIVNISQDVFYYCHKDFLFNLIDELVEKEYWLINVERVIK